MDPTRRRLKLVVSDFHLGTGRYGPGGERNHLEDFFFDERFVEFLEFHRTGEFHDAEVELIINGDFFNLLQLADVAPEHDLFTETVCMEVMEKVFIGHKRLFDALHLFARSERRRVAFVLGNHDPGLVFDGVQTQLRDRIGDNVDFYMHAYDFDGVHVEHGNQFDHLNQFDFDRLYLTRGLPEPVINLPFGSHYLIHVMTPYKAERPYLDKVVPHGRFFRWALLTDTRWLLGLAFRSLIFFIRAMFVPTPHRRFAPVDLARRILKYSASPRLDKEAKETLDKGGHRIVIFGHSHVAMFKEYGDGKVYVNTGTWNHVTSLDMGSLGRIVRLTYGVLEWNEDDRQWEPHLREWKGYHRVVEEVYR